MGNFKHSIFGYEPVSVTNKLNSIENEFSREFNGLCQEKDNLIQQRERLMKEIEELKQQISIRADLKDNIAERLVDAYLKDSLNYLAEMKLVEKSEGELAGKISEREMVLLKLQAEKVKMKNDISELILSYRSMLERLEEGD